MGDLPWPEMTGEHSCSQHLAPEVLVQVSRAGQTHRYFWTAAEPVAVAPGPRSCICQLGACAPGGTPQLSAFLAPPRTVFCVSTGPHLPISPRPQPARHS